MKELHFLPQYTEAARESTDRTRKILLIMIIASILIFTAFWNTRNEGWVNSRLALAKANLDLWSNKDATPPTGQEDVYRQAKQMEVRTKYQAEETFFWIQKIRAEQVSQIQVPVLGISFDVNDLGLIGGVTFAVLLMWVNYSLWHHSNNLKLAFDFARGLDSQGANGEGDQRLLYHTYQNLAMRQVLTIPPRPTSTKPADTQPDKFKHGIRQVSKLLYALPLLVQARIVFNDWQTIAVGEMTNPKATKFVLAMGTFFFILIAALTVTCYYRWSRTYETWKNVAEEI
ncbi:MAG TPA: hypothetical protein VGO56_14970 [Pyrinomonadaceae bacterium]|jgi:hypothetical protein|nr:hypothetical protein [Pyrinomonadaceae bacterium]